MAGENSKDNMKVFKVISGVVFGVIALALIAFLVFYVVTCFCGTMYITYADGWFYSINSGMTLVKGDTETFTIKDFFGWGEYSVLNSTVTIESNISGDSSYDFVFFVEGEDESKLFSETGDLTSAFSSDNSGYITVDYTGSFDVSTPSDSMAEILTKVYGATVTISGSSDLDLSLIPYFKIVITSPDESDVIEIPFTIFTYPEVSIDQTYIIF